MARMREGVQAGTCWKAGRRRAGSKVVVRLRDVRMGWSGCGGRKASGGSESVPGDASQSLNRTGSDGSECSGNKSKSAKFGSNCGYAGSVAIDGDTMEEVLVMASGGRAGRYAVGSRWHEPTMIAMMRQFGSPSLRWRFGDG